MFYSDNPIRAREVADRLRNYYNDEFPTLTVRTEYVPNKGTLIIVSAKEIDEFGIAFGVDQLDNGASGFRDEALRRIIAYMNSEPYTPPVPKSGTLVFDDVMTTTFNGEAERG